MINEMKYTWKDLQKSQKTVHEQVSPLRGYDPVLGSLIRRVMTPKMAHDLVGVQPMSAPRGGIFNMRSRSDENEPE
jgi:hypothetical protein